MNEKIFETCFEYLFRSKNNNANTAPPDYKAYCDCWFTNNNLIPHTNKKDDEDESFDYVDFLVSCPRLDYPVPSASAQMDSSS